MQSCLGLYIENNIIKYAKTSKERETVKVESYGVKFYDDLEKAIKQIVTETFSFKTPISTNLADEQYTYANVFSLLNKKDLEKAIGTEFDYFCNEKGKNRNATEYRRLLFDNYDDKDKTGVLYAYVDKSSIVSRLQSLDGYRVNTIIPLPIAIKSLNNFADKRNSLIINIEEETSFTTIVNGKIYRINKIEDGMKQILDSISLKENSYAKAYEVCKNTTIYTSEGSELQLPNDEGYLPDIMPTLYSIAEHLRKIVNESTEKFSKIYITGTASLINNADLYFQEYITEVPCELLRPYFIENTGNLSVKDYMEVNSAISIALMGLGEGISGMNFKHQSFADKIPSWLKVEVSPEKTKKEKKNLGGFFTWDLGQKLDKTEVELARVAVALFLIVLIYSILSGLVNYQLEKKMEEADESINNTNSQIALANSDNEKIKSKTNDYTTMIKNLEDANDKITDRNKSRNAIPNLLNQIMSVIPEQVQLTSIENSTGSHVIINAQSSKYEQLGFFVAKLKNDSILINVVSTAGQKDNNVVTIKIEGDLP